MFLKIKRGVVVFLENSSFMHVDETCRFDIPILASQATPHSSTRTAQGTRRKEVDAVLRVATTG